MFNHSSDPWYTYMQPFRIVFLRKMIKAQQQAKQQAQQQAQQQAAKVQEEAEKEEIIHS
jgi:hypothetical protein